VRSASASFDARTSQASEAALRSEHKELQAARALADKVASEGAQKVARLEGALAEAQKELSSALDAARSAANEVRAMTRQRCAVICHCHVAIARVHGQLAHGSTVLMAHGCWVRVAHGSTLQNAILKAIALDVEKRSADSVSAAEQSDVCAEGPALATDAAHSTLSAARHWSAVGAASTWSLQVLHAKKELSSISNECAISLREQRLEVRSAASCAALFFIRVVSLAASGRD